MSVFLLSYQVFTQILHFVLFSHRINDSSPLKLHCLWITKKYHNLQHYSQYAYHYCHLKPSLLLNLCSPFQYFLPSTTYEYFSIMTSAQRIPLLHFTFLSKNRSPTFNVSKLHIPHTSSLSKLPQSLTPYIPLHISIFTPSLTSPCGLMDKAFPSGGRDCGFKSHLGLSFSFIIPFLFHNPNIEQHELY